MSDRQQIVDEFWKEWEASQRPIRDVIRLSEEAALEFSKLGIRSLLLLNGGALIALPAFATFSGTPDKELMFWSVASFAVGLVTCMIGLLLAYYTVAYQGGGRRMHALEVAAGFEARHHPDRAEEKLREESEAAEKVKSYNRKGEGCRIAAIVFLFLSLGGFVSGIVFGLGAMWPETAGAS